MNHYSDNTNKRHPELVSGSVLATTKPDTEINSA
jgi:hypothetical protein